METIAAVRLFSVRRWAAPVHRECVCADGSNADSGDDRAEVSIAAGGESSRGAAGVDHAEATARCGCHTGVAGKISRQEFIQRETICCRGLNFHLLRKKHNWTTYLLVASGPSSERVCITRRMESRVTMPTIWGAPSSEPLTTGI